ncbi:hypothetical protein Tsubulata_016567 [Turnera subulata]|uniref:WRKY transcription factor n=1 Tax=Turnera subulata TaxID=218843 RepID=A0A9Q0FD97_9ROSI|nr:hypothetical protein Tsubulata_016567 [Turnera subulata]
MERKEGVKLEKVVESSSSFPDHFESFYPLQSVFEVCNEADKSSSLGFMELLGMQDYLSPSLLDMLQVPSSTSSVLVHPTPPAAASGPVSVTKVESPEVVSNNNQPATPNSSSISSASSEALNDEVPVKAADNNDEGEQQKTKKELKPKKTNQKRQREPRFAFMTKSEVDHLEDGYRWRKYGQKAVKNSPFPRSYYRCTTASCNVKKRVERSFTDPTIVVTTYEGQHTHPSPVMPRPSFAGPPPESGFAAASLAMPMQRRLHHQQHQQPFGNGILPSGFGYNNGSNTEASFLQERRFCTYPAAGSGLLKDHGLLQDIVPSYMLKDE